MVYIHCLSPANTNHLFKQLRYLPENKRSAASIFPRHSNKFSWLQDRFRKFCPTMACGSVFRVCFFFFFFGLFLQFVKGKTDRFLEKKGKKNKKRQSKKRPIRGPFIMESSHVTLRENGNKMICQMGNRIRGLPIAEYLPPWCSFLFFFSLREILPFSCVRNKF